MLIFFNLYEKQFNNNSIFVFHHINYANSFPFSNALNKYQIWSLGNFSFGIRVNPHYFGPIKLKSKNKETKFFITSTIKRKYNFLVSAAEKNKNDNLKFHFIVVGKIKAFSKKDIPINLQDYFTFRYNISYSELYKEIYKSDFIIINLDPDNIEDIKFQKIRITGSAQISYGFLKPVLINEYFSTFYNFNFSNSLIYNNKNFSEVMKNAINLKNDNYNKIQRNLLSLSKDLYTKSLLNIKYFLEL